MHRIVIALYPGVQPLDAVGPHDAFAGANQALIRSGRAPFYDLALVGETPTVQCESGLRLGADPLGAIAGDTLLIPGGRGSLVPMTPGFAAWLGEATPDRLITVCTGTFVAADAHLITTGRVTTHWAYAEELARRHPDLIVDARPVWIHDGHVWSSGGVSAGLDVALAVIADDLGAELAQLVAQWLVMYVRRPGNQSQFLAPVWQERARDERIRSIEQMLAADPGAVHRVDTVAAWAGMSTRHLQRRFRAETGRPLGAYLKTLRVTAAQRQLLQTTSTLARIARDTGFGSEESLRRAFHDEIGISPGAYRARFTPAYPRHHPVEEQP